MWWARTAPCDACAKPTLRCSRGGSRTQVRRRNIARSTALAGLWAASVRSVPVSHRLLLTAAMSRGEPGVCAGFCDVEFMECVDRAVSAAVKVLSTEGGTIVLTGCGTSGRMGFWCARSFNAVLKRLGKPPAFQYLVSGGDTALLLSDELPEVRPWLWPVVRSGAGRASHWPTCWATPPCRTTRIWASAS